MNLAHDHIIMRPLQDQDNRKLDIIYSCYRDWFYQYWGRSNLAIDADVHYPFEGVSTGKCRGSEGTYSLAGVTQFAVSGNM